MTPRRLFLGTGLAAVLAAAVGLAPPAAAELPPKMVQFKTLREGLTALLPQTSNLSRREIVLEDRHLDRLRRYRNWDTQETRFTVYHAYNERERIVRSVLLFPERTRQGTLLVAVALDNQGGVTGALLLEAQEGTLRWVVPLLRAGYMQRFRGAGPSLDLSLDREFREADYPPISETYALRLANAVKKSAQLFTVFFLNR